MSGECDKLINQLNSLSSEGSLTLGIFCIKCNAQFELGREAAAMAWITGTSFMEYLNYVQSSKCPICDNKDKT
jgi:hypothetical protein